MNPYRSIHLRPVILSALLLSLPIFGAGLVSAESIRTYGDCKPCPGTIALEAAEVRPLLDTAGMAAVRQLSPETRRVIKLDIDGKIAEGDADSPDEGYEIALQATSGMVYIRSLVDRSYIHLVADSAGANRGGFIGWNPEIFLQAGVEDRFEQSVSIDTAWEKVRNSHVYQWAANFVDGAEGAEPLADRLRYVVQRLAEGQ
jgi:hypothetical protein